jgi:hypothetical protein
MSSGVRAVEQIGNLLNQAGVPPGISLDISQRLLTATGLGRTGRRGPLNLDDYFSRSADFYNAFRPPEQNPRSSASDQAIKDGIPGSAGDDGAYYYYGFGQEGEEGKDGKDGRDGRRSGRPGGGPIWFPPIFVPGPKPWMPNPRRDPPRQTDCCDELRRRIARLGRRVREIEEKLKKTVEC